MNPRRSRSVKLVSAARATTTKPHLEVDVPCDADDDPRMSSSADNTVYCCIARGRKVIYRYSSSGRDGEDPETESTAALCLEHAPPHHRHYVHTAGSRSYAFLAGADGHTFFAIIDPCVGNAGALHFLERVRDVFLRTAARRNSNGFHDALVPAVQRLVASLEKMPHAAFVLDDNAAVVDRNRRGGGANNEASSTTSSSKVPLLSRSGSRKEKKKSKEKKANVSPGDSEDDARGGGVRIDMPPEDVGGMSLERSASQPRMRRLQQPSRSVWMRHVKIIIVVDAVICLLLFAAWLAVCKGFQCVSG